MALPRGQQGDASTVTRENWSRVEKLFNAALERPPEQRRGYLDEACAGDTALRDDVETLLASFESAGTFIETPAANQALHFAMPPGADSVGEETVEAEPPTPAIGRRLGSYEIVREIGRGGMGSVYLAQRADEEFQKNVAIKLIRPGLDNAFIIRRFRNERQILAGLDHPYIARLLDGGTTEDGLPYFVMEYVDGQPIQRYADTHKLSIPDRLKLFRRVCSAVHYAHRNRIIHRDLKPGNIMVTADGMPKLLDFGISKILGSGSTSSGSEPTTATSNLMTPEYASPEQIRGESPTVSSDVYAMGVILYELLSGHRPYRLRSRLPHEIARVICDEEPDRPSVATNLIEVIDVDGGEPIEITPETVSSARNSTPDALRRQLAGTLDNVTLRALSKEACDRYASVEDLSEDIRRYLEGLPVSAPPYFARPRPTALEAQEPSTADRSLAVLPFKVLNVQEKTDEYLGMGLADAIITKLSSVRRITVRPTSAVIKYADGEQNAITAGYELNVGYVLDGRIQRAGDRLRITVQLVRVRDGAPLWATKLDENFTDVFTAEDSISEHVAQALIPRLSGDERELLLKHETENPDAYREYVQGRYFWNKFSDEAFPKAFEHFKEAIRLDPHCALAHVGIADYFNWAAVYSLGRPTDYFPRAKEAATRALEIDNSLAEAYAALAFTTLLYDWDWAKAESLFKRSIELNGNYAPARQWYSYVLATRRRFDEAIAEIKRAQEINPLSLMDKSMTGWTYFHARQYELAEREVKKALELDRNFGNGWLVLGFIYERMGRYDEAIELFNKAVQLMPGTIVPFSGLGCALALANRRAEAKQVIAKLEEIDRNAYVCPYYLALIHATLGEVDAAFEALERGYQCRDEWLIWLATEPRFDGLRSDPRYDSLLSRVGLTEAMQPVPLPGVGGRPPAVDTSSLASTLYSSGPARNQPGPVPGAQAAASHTATAHKSSRATGGPTGGLGAKLIAAVAVGLLLVVSALFILNRFYGRIAVPKHFETTRIARLTATGNITAVAISLDGKYVAYAANDAGKQGLWVRQVGAGNSIPVVPPAQVDCLGITFSPDGAYLYYVISQDSEERSGELYRVPVLGGSAKTVVTDVARRVVFSPDGRQIAFTRIDLSSHDIRLIVAGADGAGERQISSHKYLDRSIWSSTPAWSPDGSAIMWAVQSADSEGLQTRLVEVNIASGAESDFRTRRWDYISEISWLADGGGLLFNAQDPSSSALQLWSVSYPEGQPRRLTSDLSEYLGVSVSKDAESLVALQSQTLSTVWVLPASAAPPPAQITKGISTYLTLSWSPEKTILYATDVGGASDVWEMRDDGSGAKQLTFEAGKNAYPAASPDGRYIVFLSNRSGNWNIWRMNRDGADLRRFTSDETISNSPRYSPDGEWIYFHHTSAAGHMSIWRMPAEGGTPVELIDKPSVLPSISRSKGMIACWYSKENDKLPSLLGVFPPEGGQPLKLIELPRTAIPVSPLCWSPDEKSIAYIDTRAGVSNIWSQPIDGGPPKQLTSFKTDQMFSFDWASDGRIVCSRGFNNDDAVLISNVR